MNAPSNEAQTESSLPSNRAPITAALLSLVLFILFLVTALGQFTLLASAATGLAAIIFGAIAVKHRAPRGVNITAICIGSVTLLLSIAIQVFALIFVGAIVV